MPKKSDDAASKRPRGRPTLYKPEYCDMVIAMGMEGFSIAQMAAHIGVDKASLLDWRAKHEDFASALARATTLSQCWWENRGRQGLGDKNFNAALWMKMVGSMFRDDYSERKEITGAAGGPLKVQTTVVDVTSLDSEDLEALEVVLKKAAEAGKAG